MLIQHVPDLKNSFTNCSSFSLPTCILSLEINLEPNETILEPSERTDGKYMVLPSGELHIREVGPEDGYKSYQCRTKHRLTGETRLSATKGRLVITGKLIVLPIFIREKKRRSFLVIAMGMHTRLR